MSADIADSYMQNNIDTVYMTSVWNKVEAKVESFSSRKTSTVPPLVSLDNEPIDNIKDIGTPEDAPNIDITKTEKQNINSDTADPATDINNIKNAATTYFTVLLTMHIAYVWYFNLTQCTGEATVYKKLDILNVFSVVTGYFYNIIKFIDTGIMEKLSYYTKFIIDNTFIQDRTIFILLIGVSSLIVKYLYGFIIALYDQITSKKFNMKKIPGPTSLFSLLYFGFVAYGLVNTFKEGGPVANFIALNPIISFIGIIILVAILYVPTTVTLPFFLFGYIAYYSLFGATPDPGSLYEKVSGLGFYEALHSIMNIKHAMFEPLEDTPLKNAIEIALRGIFKYLPYIVLIAGLIPVLIQSIGISNAPVKYSFISITIATMIGFVYMSNIFNI